MIYLALSDPTLKEEWKDYSTMKTLTCRNHPTAEYLTKNPWLRSIHVIRLPESLGDKERTDTGECRCPFSDLVVVK
jgi:hypothetical protein